tara:strand:+ start:352 stop:1290 length:939 start_codon:yes stop_codon:yes gene_type:complete
MNNTKMVFNKLFILFFLSLFSFSSFSQRTSIGFFYGTSIGYNSVISDIQNYHGLFDVNLNDITSFSLLDDNNLSNNLEGINGRVLGIKFNLPVTDNISFQSELEYQQLEFNHIIHQNANYVVYQELDFASYGYQDVSEYKIANYFWRVNYFNFPFLVKLYPSNNLSFQMGVKFGFLLKAEETRALAIFNILNNNYLDYTIFSDETVVYEFFDSDSGIDSHGFDKDEWPFNWNAAIIGGIGYEDKLFYVSLRYSLGLLPFFKEIENKDDDFFDIYNTTFDQNIYSQFDMVEPFINNNFELQSINLVIGFHLSN